MISLGCGQLNRVVDDTLHRMDSSSSYREIPKIYASIDIAHIKNNSAGKCMHIFKSNS